MATDAKQVMDMRPQKSLGADISNEHQRRWTEKGWERAQSEGNYDRSREHLNFEITKGGKISPIDKTRSIPTRIKENIQSRGIKDPNAGRDEPYYNTSVCFIFGGSRERMHELAYGNQKVNLELGSDNSHITRDPQIEAWAKDVYAFVSGKYGEENIASFVVHLDESNPHVHCVVLPIKDGVFRFNQIFAGNSKYEFARRTRQLHDEFSKVNERWGMKRGTSTSITGAKHRSTEQYRRELNAQCTALEEDVKQHKVTLEGLQQEIKKAQTRVKGLGTMVDNLKKKYADKEAELKEIRQKMLDKDGNAQWLMNEKERISKELDAIQTQWNDKCAKLDAAKDELKKLTDDKVDLEALTAKLKSEAQKYSTTIQSGVNNGMLDSLLVMLTTEHRSILVNLSPEERSLFDDSFINDVAERGAEILHVATLLFLNYVDEATTFAESHGGGGTSSDLKWGDDDDKDEAARRFRCLMHAAHMMRPAAGKKVRR